MISNINFTKWHVLIGCFLSYTFDALDILILIIALPTMRESLELSQTQAGFLVTSTLFGIGISSFVLGQLADVVGRKKALLMSLISFGILTIFIAFTTHWIQILVLRFLAGIGLGGVWGIVAALVNESWPPHQRARATSFVLSSFAVGSGLAALLAGALLTNYGWRPLFFIGGFLVIIPIVYVWYFVPESKLWIEQKKNNVNKRSSHVKALFSKDYIQITLVATIASALALIAYWGSMTWLPTFLIQERGLNSAQMGIFMAVLNIGTFLGYNIFGWLADVIGKRKAIIISLMGCGIFLPIYSWTFDFNLLFILGPIYAFFIAFSGLLGSYFAELYPIHIRATGAGFCFNLGRGISALAPLILGSVAITHGYSFSISLCGGIFILSAITFLFLPKDKSQILRRYGYKY